MIIPEDDEHDFTPVDPPFIQVGQTVRFQYETQGEVTAVTFPGTGGLWIWEIDDAAAYAVLDEDDPNQETVYRRQAKPAQGTKFTAADGSRWVYPALPHGLYRCWQAGSVHGEGLAARSAIEGLVED